MFPPGLALSFPMLLVCAATVSCYRVMVLYPTILRYDPSICCYCLPLSHSAIVLHYPSLQSLYMILLFAATVSYYRIMLVYPRTVSLYRTLLVCHAILPYHSVMSLYCYYRHMLLLQRHATIIATVSYYACAQQSHAVQQTHTHVRNQSPGATLLVQFVLASLRNAFNSALTRAHFAAPGKLLLMFLGAVSFSYHPTRVLRGARY
eukprot:1532991-Rhodomonas_salina.1